MTISEMHDLFRVLAQQVGMQLVRGILPQHIDSFINIEISETVRNLLLTNAHTILQDDINLQSSTLNPINAFRTLYRRGVITVNTSDKGNTTKASDCYVIKLTEVTTPMLYLGFNITYSDIENKRVACRLIGASVLETTLRDFCNGADEQNPIAVLLNNGNECVEIYTGLSNKTISSVSVSYIKSPNKVKFTGGEDSVDCDLPDYMHYSIVSGAANRYLLSLNSQPAITDNTKKNN